MSRWHFASGQWVGARERQEDAVMVIRQSGIGEDENVLIVVGDGMGGHAGGDIASRAVVSGALEVAASRREGKVDLKALVDSANAHVRSEMEADPARRGMGSTLVALDFKPSSLRWASVGDSLLLTVTKDGVKRLNQDHSMAPLLDGMAEKGEISKEEAAAPSARSQLRSVIRGGDISLVDFGHHDSQLAEGTTLIVASDGIATLSDSQLVDLVAASVGADDCLDRIISAVQVAADPYQDNLTVVVAQRAPSSARTSALATVPSRLKTGKRSLPIVLAILAVGAVIGLLATIAWLRTPQPSAPVLTQGVDKEAIASSANVTAAAESQNAAQTVPRAPTGGIESKNLFPLDGPEPSPPVKALATAPKVPAPAVVKSPVSVRPKEDPAPSTQVPDQNTAKNESVPAGASALPKGPAVGVGEPAKPGVVQPPTSPMPTEPLATANVDPAPAAKPSASVPDPNENAKSPSGPQP